MSSINGYTRPLSAETTVKKIGRLTTLHTNNSTFTTEAVSYSAAAANEKYLDMHDGAQVVAGGYAKLFTGIGLGVLSADTGEGLTGQFDLFWRGWLQLNTGETPAANTVLYWDIADKELTVDADGGTNIKVGFAFPNAGSASYQVVATASTGTLPVGTWVLVQLLPNA